MAAIVKSVQSNVIRSDQVVLCTSAQCINANKMIRDINEQMNNAHKKKELVVRMLGSEKNKTQHYFETIKLQMGGTHTDINFRLAYFTAKTQ